jgi:hypothetical protein
VISVETPSARIEKKVILFFSCEPGGAEILIPVIHSVISHTLHKVIVLGYGLGAERFTTKGIEFIAIDPIALNDLTLFKKYNPNFIITSATSLPERDMSEKHLWINARKAGIPSIAFLDQWQNYSQRFSGVDELEKLAFMPDYINCINATGKNDMINVGFDRDLLFDFGHPYLTTLEGITSALDADSVRKRLGIDPGQKIALFASEAIREHFGDTRGYDQFDALRVFMNMLAFSSLKYMAVIKLHPKDDLEEYKLILGEYSKINPIVIHNEVSSIECIQIADCVCGITSIMLIEAFVLGKSVLSIQPNLKVNDPMVLSRMGYITSITDANCELRLEDAFFCLEEKKQPFEFVFKENEFLSFVKSKI